MDAWRVDADSSGARDGVARLSGPLRGVKLRLSEERVAGRIASAPRFNLLVAGTG